MRPSEHTAVSVDYVDVLEGEATREIRRSIRYPLRSPATFTWLGLDGVEHQGKGTSRDISEGGAYIVTKSCPALRSTIGVVVRFSSLPGLSRSYRLELSGRVVRIEPLLHSKENWGFAVSCVQPVLQEVGDSGNVH
jgi:PilZ domain